MNVPRPVAPACRRAGVANTPAGSPIGPELPAARRLAPPRGRPQAAHNASARQRQIPQPAGQETPRPSPHGPGKGQRRRACVAAALFWRRAPMVAPGQARPPPGLSCARHLLASPAAAPPGERGRPQGAHFGEGLNVPARQLSANVVDCTPLPPRAPPHGPLVARSGLLPSLIGSTYFRSRSQGKKIQVSCDTSVMKVWHIGAPCGLA